MENVEKRKGELYILGSTLLWSFFPIFITLSYASISGLVSLAWSTVLGAVFFLGIIIYRKSWHHFKNRTFWKYTLGLSIFNGIFFYTLYYIGLESTTPGNASLIGLIEILTSFLFFNMFKKEHISKEHKIGAGLMIFGGLIVLSNNFSHFNTGDLFILIATMCGPIGNHFQQLARKIAPTENVLFGRYIISAPFAFLIAYLMNESFVVDLNSKAMLFLVLNGLLIFGVSKIFWVEGIHRISVTKSISLSSVGPLLTIFFAWIILNQTPTIWQLTSFVPLFFGILLLTDKLKFKPIEILP